MRRLPDILGYLLPVALLAIVIGLASLSPPLEAQSGNFRQVSCDASVAVSGSTAATAQIVALAAGQRIVVCGFVLNGAGATTAKLVRGTGTNCGTGTADVTGAMKFVDGSVAALGSGSGTILRLPIGEALCWTNSGAVQVSGLVSYARF